MEHVLKALQSKLKDATNYEQVMANKLLALRDESEKIQRQLTSVKAEREQFTRAIALINDHAKEAQA